MRLCLRFWHGSEQYLTARLAVVNGLPHSLHRTRRILVASFAARFLHGVQ